MQDPDILPPRSKNWTLRIVIALIVLLLTAAFIPTILVFFGILPVSQGARVGVVNKLSDRGYIAKSSEGTLFMAGDAAGVQGNTWAFSVVDPVVEQQVKEAMDSQHRVRLEYKEYHTTWGRTDTNYHIVNVIILTAKPTTTHAP